MGLVLGLNIGDDVYLNDTAFRLDEIYSYQQVLMTNMETGKTHEVVVGRRTEVLPDVFFALGDRSTRVMARISIDAPRNMKLLHGEKYRQLRKEEVLPPPSTAPDMGQYKVPADIVERANELGVINPALAVAEMVRLAAPVSMPGYNRRYGEFVFFVDGDTVLGMDRLTPGEQAYYDSRNYEERLEEEDDTSGEAEIFPIRKRA